MFSFYTTRHNFFPAHKAALHPWQPGKQFRCPSQGYQASTAKGSPAAFEIRHPYHDLSNCLEEKGIKINGNKEASLPGRRCGVSLLHPLEDNPGNHRHTHRRSWSSCCRWFPHGSAYGTKSSDLRACQALLGYLVLPGTIRLAFHSGIHPHLPQRRRDASSLPSPVAAGAVGCKVPATRSASALGAC